MSIGSDIRQLKEHIAVSLFISPATSEELHQRDFLQHIDIVWIERFLIWLKQDGYIFQRGNKYHTYKKIARTKLSEYDLL